MNELKVLGKEKVGSFEFTGIEGGFGEDKKAMLVKDIAAIHGRPVFKVNELINRNRKKFRDGVDIIDLKENNFAIFLKDSGFTQNQINASNNIYLLSERGYAKLLKILEDDKAWEIYDELVDNYFNMRQTIKTDNKALVANKRLAIMEENAKTRKANLLYKIAMATKSEFAKESLLANAGEVLTGQKAIPVMRKEEFSATAIGNLLGISANKVGRIANELELKAEQPGQNKYGRWGIDKASNGKEVPNWVYFKPAIAEIEKYLGR
ncbi:Tec protein [Ligilactobacillus agilis]|uniref:Tec protein n=1 Tax=Ligilactobacillus agilis TaxID=1601 RepID=A0A6F9Y430_9LACO|nr:ORF6N domain-containing protein [Ligilactobacillus agilis]GET12314.1 Tec protein [Ligilactobacillus agilis]